MAAKPVLNKYPQKTIKVVAVFTNCLHLQQSWAHQLGSWTNSDQYLWAGGLIRLSAAVLSLVRQIDASSPSVAGMWASAVLVHSLLRARLLKSSDGGSQLSDWTPVSVTSVSQHSSQNETRWTMQKTNMFVLSLVPRISTRRCPLRATISIDSRYAAPAAINRHLLPMPRLQQTSCMLLPLLIDGTDRQTNRWTLYNCIV